MTAQIQGRSIAMVFAVAVAAVLACALASAAPAYAAEESGASLGAGEVQTQATKTVSKTFTFTWFKAGKELYQWGNYVKSVKNGTMKPREGTTQYFTTPDVCENILSVSKPKISNTKVLSAKTSLKYGYMKYTLKKVGKTTVTYTMKYVNENGTSVTYKATEKHRFVRYANPVSSLKVGGVEYAGKLKSSPQYVTGRAISGKVVAKAAKGWKLIKIRRVNSAITSGEFVKQVQVKNGKNVNIAKTAQSVLEVICYNTSGKYYASVILSPSFKYEPIAG